MHVSYTLFSVWTSAPLLRRDMTAIRSPDSLADISSLFCRDREVLTLHMYMCRNYILTLTLSFCLSFILRMLINVT